MPPRRLKRPPRAVGILSLIAAAAALGGLAAFGWATLRPLAYESTAVLMVSLPDHAGEATFETLRARPVLASTFAHLAEEPATIRDVARRLGLDISDERLHGFASVRVDPVAGLITISIRDSDADRAARFCAALADRTRMLAAMAGGEPGLTVVESATVAERPVGQPVALEVAIGTAAAVTLLIAWLVWRNNLANVRSRRATVPLANHAVPQPNSSLALLAGSVVALAVVLGLALELPAVVVLAPYALGVALAAAVPEAGFAFLIFLLPQQDPNLFGAAGLKLPVIAALAYGVGVRMVIVRRLPVVTPGLVLGTGFLAICLLSAIPELNGLEGDRAVSAGASFLQLGGVLTVFVLSAWTFRDRDPRPILWLAAASSAVAAGLGVMQLLARPGIPLAALYPTDAEGVARISGPFQNANYYGLFLTVALVLVLGLSLETPRFRGLMLGNLLLIIVALAATLSRGALISAGVGVVVLAWLRDRRLGLAATALAVVFGFAAYPLVVGTRLENSRGRADAAQAAFAASDADRAGSVLAGVDLWADDPVLGVGFAQYEYEAARYVGQAFATSAHNQFLKLLAEQGLIGAVLVVGALGALVRALLRTAAFPKFTLGAMAAFAVSGLFLEPLTNIQTTGLMWLIAGVGASGTRWPRAAERLSTSRLHVRAAAAD